MTPRLRWRGWLWGLLLAFLAVPGTAEARPVWIDSDPSCGLGSTRDVDDCWALLQALRTPELEVRGISTVFGNADAARTHATARALVRRAGGPSPAIHAGAAQPGPGAGRTDAARALAAALRAERLTIVALGPLTNVAGVLERWPRLAGRIERLIAVAGRRPGQPFRPGRLGLVHLHDRNFADDPDAFERVLATRVPLVLVPFELANQVRVNASDLDRLAQGSLAARWLSDVSRDWLSYWQRWLWSHGFAPFDSLAVAYAARPEHFGCERLSVSVRRARGLLRDRGLSLEVSASTGSERPVPGSERPVLYCSGLDAGFKDELLARLGAAP